MAENLNGAVKGFDGKQFSRALKMLRGSRTASKLAEEAKVSRSFVSKGLSGLLPGRPSVRILMKLTDSAANPENGITLEMLMASAGYSDEEIAEETAAIHKSGSNIKKIPIEAAITDYFGTITQEPFMALLNALLEKGVDCELDMNLRKNKGYFEINCVSPENGQSYVGIPVFCQENTAIQDVIVAMSISLMHIVADDRAKDQVLYFMTDNDQIYEFLSEFMPCPPVKAAFVLFTEDHKTFTKESRKKATNGSMPEIFPESLVSCD
ncbi:MAG: hypothetical protein Q4C61_11405 [Lachnospiraceae bacterium]|nr:hypothetical protein [Lachnospiraceae bacterium]